MGKEKKKSKLENIIGWLLFEYIAVGVPVVVMLAVRYFLLRDLVIEDYAEDLLLLSTSIVINVIAELFKVRDNIHFIVYALLMIVDLLVFLFFVGAYCSIYGLAPVLASEIDRKRVCMFSFWVMAANLLIGLIVSGFED